MIKGQIMSSDDEKVDEIELKAAERKDATEEEKVRVDEAEKRYQVARELEEHPVFKSLKIATANTDVSIMLDAIVDRYFEFVGGSNDTLAEFNVDSALIQMALDQTIYLISMDENGVVLAENGTIDEEATRAQQEAKRVDHLSVSTTELTYEQKMEAFRKALDEGPSNKEQDIRENMNPNVRKLYDDLQRMNERDLAMFFETDAGKQQLKDALDNKETDKNISNNRKKSNLVDKEDVMVNALQARFYQLSTLKKGEITSEVKQEMLDCLKELQKYSKGAAKKLVDPETGKIKASKVLEDYTEYVNSYSEKENESVLKRYGATQINKVYKVKELDPKSKREVLEAALSLYMQKGETGKEKAIIVFGSLGLLKDVVQKDFETGKPIVAKTLDMEVFRNVYNSTRNGSNMSFENIVKFVQHKNSKMAAEHTEMLIEQIQNNKFTARTQESLDNENSRNSNDSNIDIKPELEEDKEQPEKPKKTVKDLFKLINTRLRANYRKTKFYRTDRNLDELFDDEVTAEERKEIIISAYKRLEIKEMQKRHDALEVARSEGRELKPGEGDIWSRKFLEDYMKSNARIFGDCIDVDENGNTKVNSNRINKYYYFTKERREELQEFYGIDVDSVIDSINEAAYHKRTPNLLVRGVIESAKDVLGVVGRRINYTKLGRLLENTVLTLTDGSTATEEIFQTKDPEYVKNESVISEIENAWEKGITLEESAKRLEQERRKPVVSKLEDIEQTEEEQKREEKAKKRRAKSFANSSKKQNKGILSILKPKKAPSIEKEEESHSIYTSKTNLEELAKISQQMGTIPAVINPNHYKVSLADEVNARPYSPYFSSTAIDRTVNELKVQQLKEGCISILSEKGLAIQEEMESWPVEALASYVAKNGGAEKLQELKDEVGYIPSAPKSIFPKLEKNLSSNDSDEKGMDDDDDVR